MIKRFVIAAILVALFLGGVGYFNLVFKPKMIGEFMAKMKPPAATVTAERAGTKEWIDRVQSIGTLIAIQGVEVSPEVAGIVKDYYFESGNDVAKGDKLVALDTSVEEADLVKNRAVLLEANADLKRQASLVKRAIVSQAVVDTTTSKRDSAAASVQRMEAVIAQKNITAPFAGRLGLRRVEKGQYVKAGDPLVWLQSLDPIWIDFPVSEGDLGKLKIGAPIELGVNAYPGQVFKGEIEAFDARVAQDTRTLMVRGRLPNADHKLLPGMFANVAVLEGKAKELVTVPRTAVTYGLYGDSVWVVKEGPPAPEKTASVGEVEVPAPQLTAERRFVRVGPSKEDQVAILEGVKAGEQVITSGQLKLHPDAAIKIDNSRPLTPAAERPKQ
ncbi:MAG TPA: efflux RND transporter periplasmic adaptor subunit [Methyloceanibacter sp.]|jgi:membrane fusion protein (multidrug efflux system)